jgi:hypothetical protein
MHFLALSFFVCDTSSSGYCRILLPHSIDQADAPAHSRNGPVETHGMSRNRPNCKGNMIYVDAYLQYAFGCADEVLE